MLDSSRAPIHGYCAKSGKLMRGWSLVSERRSATSATSFVLAVLITYREQWAQEQDQHQHREENQNIVVHIHLPLSANVSALFPPRFTIVRAPPCEIFRLSTWQKRNRSFTSASLYLSLCVHL